MRLLLVRDVFTDDATLGRLYVDFGAGAGWQLFGFTVEDEDRGLSQTMSTADIAARKVPAETAIPIGTYGVRFTYSPKYAHVMKSTYQRADGFMPEVLAVPGFRGIRIHSGNDEGDTAGCLIPGLSRDVRTMSVAKSRLACAWLYEQISKAGDETSIIIRRDSAAWAARAT